MSDTMWDEGPDADDSLGWAKKIGLTLGVVLVLAVIGLWIHHLIGGSQAKKHYVPEISLIKPPPPPPPPPKKEEPPPPKKEEIKIAQPKQEQAPEPKSADNKPAGKSLGVDADGSGAGDGFGLVGNRGGNDLLASGGGNGGGGASRAQYSMFTSSAQQILREEITKRLKVKNRDYHATYKIWVDEVGNIQRFELVPTGNADVDTDLRTALAEVRGLNLAPPPDMPQPLRFQFTLRPAG